MGATDFDLVLCKNVLAFARFGLVYYLGFEV